VSRAIAAAGTLPDRSTSAAPPWNLVHFDVRCARCGHDLRGRSEPNCPACALEFEWSEAIPLEELLCPKCGYHLYGLSDTRCPECGETFTWEQALEDYYRRRRPLFEYHWRDRPLRSFARSWVLALRPKKLWMVVDLHDPPRVGPLLCMAAVGLALAALGTAIMSGSTLWLANRGFSMYWGSWPPRLAELPGYLRSQLLNPVTYARFVGLAVWWLSSLAALMIFQQSMRLAKVRPGHVVRVWIFSVVLLSSTAIAAAWLTTLVCLMLMMTASAAAPPRPYQWMAVPFYGFCFLYLPIVWSIRQSYRLYLRIPHSAGVAIASQIIAVLSALALFTSPALLFG
jgi:ribosomal protein L37E